MPDKDPKIPAKDTPGGVNPDASGSAAGELSEKQLTEVSGGGCVTPAPPPPIPMPYPNI